MRILRVKEARHPRLLEGATPEKMVECRLPGIAMRGTNHAVSLGIA